MRAADREELALHAARMEAAVEGLSAGVLVEDDTRHIDYVNQSFCDLFGIPADPRHLVGTDCSGAAEQTKELFTDPEGFVTRIQELLAMRVFSRQEMLHMRDGRSFERDYIPIFVDDVYRGHVWVYVDVTGRERTQLRLRDQARRLEELVQIDELTGLRNRRGFGIAACQALALSIRNVRSCALLFLDLDGLKRINDEAGHGAGDEAIRQTAQLMRRTFRDCDVLARLGGDEFAVFLTDTDSEGALQAIERLKAATAEFNRVRVGGHPLSMSIGFAVSPSNPGATVEAILAEADEALYEQKRQRGGRPSVAAR